MKKLVAKKNVECMACLECVRACSMAFYKEFHPDKACLKITVRKGENKPVTCIQCGKCAKVCPNDSITQNPKTGVYMINKKTCVGCGLCAEACPLDVIVMAPETDYSSKCIACGICAKACPMDVLEVVES